MSRNLDPSALTAHLGFWLRAVSNHVSHAFAARLAGQGVTVAEWVLMRTLHGREPLAPSRIAADIGMTRGAITKLADRLIAKAMIVRRADREDKRAQTLALTPQGEALVPLLAALADANDAEFFEALSPAERAALDAMLRKMIEHHRIVALPTD